MIKGGQSFRFIADQLGSARLVVNSVTGAIVQRIDYDTFGNVVVDTNRGFQPFGFAGGLYDPDTKLLRFGARDYDPATGRWTSRDRGLYRRWETNLYVYAANDPVNLIDPTGFSARDVSIILHECEMYQAEQILDHRRAALPDPFSGVVTNAKWLFGDKTQKACADQWSELQLRLERLRDAGVFDDDWEFTTDALLGGVHVWGSGESSNPSDPVLVLDPHFRGCYVSPALHPRGPLGLPFLLIDLLTSTSP
jgi:RHS repeat-associated protein